MTLLYFAAFFALLGIVCIALPYHIGMTGVCLLLLAAVLAALWLAVGLTANWGQKRIDEAAERRHSDYRRVAARHGRRIRK